MRKIASVRIIGPGRAGGAFALALTHVGIEVAPPLGRTDDVSAAGAGVDVVIIATPDDTIAEVASAIAPSAAVILHLSGSRGLDVLAGHDRVGSVHPLMSLPNARGGADRLLDAGWFAVSGDPLAGELVTRLAGRSFAVADEHRALYHATAAIASNHTVALMGQVARLAEQVGVPREAFDRLAAESLANAAELGPARALTGPAARNDLATLDHHRAALPPDERATYEAMVIEAQRLAATAADEPKESP